MNNLIRRDRLTSANELIVVVVLQAEDLPAAVIQRELLLHLEGDLADLLDPT